jgi:hypothetical protein
MPGEPVEPPPSPEYSDPMVLVLQRQMARLKRWFQWERWLLEPRSFAPPDDPSEHGRAEDEPPSWN